MDTADLHIGPLIVRGLARVENPTRIEATIQSNSKPVESTETRRNIASIDCEKCMVEGERCVKILAFHHVLTRDELPAIYLQRAPHFYRVGRRAIAEMPNQGGRKGESARAGVVREDDV